MTDYKAYFDYLQKRSTVGEIYRKYFLYPKLCRYLTGEILDVGCGIGDLLKFQKNIIGTDINEFAVNYCKLLGLNCHLMEVDKLPFENMQFDTVLLDNVLEHISQPDPLIAEIKRVLKNNGQIIIGVPGILGMKCDPDHKLFYDESKLINLANAHSLILDKFFYAPLFKSRILSRHLRIYCLYGVFKNNNANK